MRDDAPKHSRKLKLLDAATLKLTAWYTLILIVVCVSFSTIIYAVSTRALSSPPPRESIAKTFRNDDFEVFFRSQAEHIRTSVLGNLVAINILMLVAGTGLCYLLARYTLRPIEAAMEAQGRFISDASHELRTPLAVIQTENEVALRDAKLDKKQMRNLLESNLAEVAKLRLLSDRLLRLSHSESAVLAKVDLEEVAIAALNRVIVMASAKNVSIENSVAKISVHSNADILTDILAILLDNAIKYNSPEKSAIIIRAGALGRVVDISVDDRGVGIADVDQEHIFDRFYRAESSRTSDGHGLGLALAKRLAQSIGADIIVKSVVGEGSTFTIRLPR